LYIKDEIDPKVHTFKPDIHKTRKIPEYNDRYMKRYEPYMMKLRDRMKDDVNCTNEKACKNIKE
jgi:hypothetical protein